MFDVSFRKRRHMCSARSGNGQNQNQNSLLVKRQTDNTTPGGMGLDRRGLVPSSHKRSKFRHTII